MKSFIGVLSFIAIIGLGFTSCEKQFGGLTRNISHFNEGESHNMGQNCMQCHSKGGEGEGWFEVAGTAYDTSFASTYSNVTIKLYTGPNGTGDLKYTIEADANGNFFTTKNIKFKDGLYPSLVSPNATKHMGSSIKTGACNSCHGITTGKIWSE